VHKPSPSFISTAIIIIIIILAHQHKAAGRKTRLDVTKLWLQRHFTLWPWCCGKKPHFLFAEPLKSDYYYYYYLPPVVKIHGVKNKRLNQKYEHQSTSQVDIKLVFVTEVRAAVAG